MKATMSCSMRGVRVARDAAFRVEDERGRVLWLCRRCATFAECYARHQFSVMRLKTAEIIDFCVTNFGSLIRVNQAAEFATNIIRSSTKSGTPMCGTKLGEAIRFFAIATAVLIGRYRGCDALGWCERDYHLSMNSRARSISPASGNSGATHSAKETAELRPLAAALEGALDGCSVRSSSRDGSRTKPPHELKDD